MRMHVDEARQAGSVRQVERRDADSCPDVRCKQLDAPVFDENIRRSYRRVADTVYQCTAVNKQRAGVRNIGRCRDQFWQLN